MKKIFKIGVLLGFFLFLFPQTASAQTWSTALNISNTSNSSTTPRIAVSGEGTIHAVWCDSVSGGSDLFYASKPSDDSWSSPINLSQNSGDCAGPTLITDSDNALHVAWSDNNPGGYNIFYANKPFEGSWTTPTNISNAGSQHLYDVQLVIDSNEGLHIVWQNAADQHAYYATKPSAGNWSSPSEIYNQQGDSLGLVIDSSDTLHFVWRVSDHGAATNIYYLTKPSGDAWSGASLITDCTGVAYCSYPVIASQGNTLHLAFQKRTQAGPPDKDLYYITKSGSGAWSSPIAVVQNAGDSQAFAGGIAVTSTGNVSLTWYDDTSGNYEVLYSELSGSSWTTPVNLSNTSATSEYPGVAFDEDNFPHVVWSDYTSGNSEIYYLNANQGIINTDAGQLAQPFTPSESGLVTEVQVPLCLTGNPDDLGESYTANIQIIDFDSATQKPVWTTIAGGSSIDLRTLPDCSTGYATVSSQFNYNFMPPPGMPIPLKPSLIAGRTYAILLQGSENLTDAVTLRWQATDLNPAVGSMYRNPGSYYSTWSDYNFSSVFDYDLDTSLTTQPTLDQQNLGTYTHEAVLTSYGFAVQSFTASVSHPIVDVELPLCTTGNPIDSTVTVYLYDFDEINNQPTENFVSAGNTIGQGLLPDCSVGYAKILALFNRDFNLTAGKKYSIALQGPNFPNSGQSIHWAATAVNANVGNAFIGTQGNWTAQNYSAVFKEYTNSPKVTNQAPTVDANGPYSVNEGGSVQVSATGNDPESETLTYAWDLDNNGSFEISGQTVTFSAASLSPGTYAIKVQATDPGNLSATDEATVTVNDIATFDDFVILGSEGISLKQSADILSGHVGANTSSSGPYLDAGVEASIGIGATLSSTSKLYGDSIKLKNNSQVYDVFYNDIDNSGTILGSQSTPLTLPVVPSFPTVPSFSAGTTDVTVPANTSQSLSAGSYEDLIVHHDSILVLTGGTYNFASWDLRDDAKVYIDSATEIRISGKVSTNIRAQIKPNSSSSIDASDIKIFVTGINGGSGNIGATPKAVDFGQNNVITANVYAPNGTLFMKEDTVATGAFLGKWVVVGQDTQVSFDSGF